MYGEGREYELRYSAEISRPGAARPPGGADIVRVRDVLVLTGTPGADLEGVDHSELATFPSWDLVKGRTDPPPIGLGRGLVLASLDQDEAELVLTACSPRGHYFVPIRQFGQMYSFVRETDPAELDDGRWTWDPDRVIRDALAMSRLVLDNGYSTEYAARIFDYANGEQQIMPTPVPTQYAYRVRPTARDWLTVSEADELRDLLTEYWALGDDLPERVAHALWLAEYLVSARWLDVIAPLLVVAFEALVNTSKDLVTRQFRERVPAMTEQAGSGLSTTLCDRMYDARSRWVHGARVPLYRRPERKGESWEGPTDSEQRAAVERVAKTQDALRAMLRKAITDPEFRAIFASDDSIRELWPVAV